MARMKEMSSPEKTVRPILITPPRSLRSKMRPAPIQIWLRMAILVMEHGIGTGASGTKE